MRSARWPAAVVLSVVLLSVTCGYTTGWQEGKHQSTIGEEDDFVRTMLSCSIIALVAAALSPWYARCAPDVPVGSASSHTPWSTTTKDLLTEAEDQTNLRVNSGRSCEGSYAYARVGKSASRVAVLLGHMREATI
jgi:hypothetical protein